MKVTESKKEPWQALLSLGVGGSADRSAILSDRYEPGGEEDLLGERQVIRCNQLWLLGWWAERNTAKSTKIVSITSVNTRRRTGTTHNKFTPLVVPLLPLSQQLFKPGIQSRLSAPVFLGLGLWLRRKEREVAVLESGSRSLSLSEAGAGAGSGAGSGRWSEGGPGVAACRCRHWAQSRGVTHRTWVGGCHAPCIVHSKGGGRGGGVQTVRASSVATRTVQLRWLRCT